MFPGKSIGIDDEIPQTGHAGFFSSLSKATERHQGKFIPITCFWSCANAGFQPMTRITKQQAIEEKQDTHNLLTEYPQSYPLRVLAPARIPLLLVCSLRCVFKNSSNR